MNSLEFTSLLPTEKVARLGLNIDHFATLRQLRGTPYPNLLHISEKAKEAGADQITVHLREDKRHIQPADVESLVRAKILPLNLEMAATETMLRFALKIKPEAVCIVPEKRQELTTEGGLNLNHNQKKIQKIITTLKEKGIRVSLFLEPSLTMIRLAKKYGADAVEIHTGSYCRFTQRDKLDRAAIQKKIKEIESAAILIRSLGLEAHAGHGFDAENVRKIAGLTQKDGSCLIEEFNIGHYLVCRASEVGIKTAIREMIASLRAL